MDYTSQIEEETQISNFKWCINVAVDLELPMQLHGRSHGQNNAFSRMLQIILDIDKERKLKVYLHYFNGTESDLIDWVKAYKANVSNYP